MGDYEKLLQKARDSNKNFSFNDLCKLAELAGFEFVRPNGSHKMYRHNSISQRMNFQNYKGKAKPYQVRQLLNAIEEINREREEK
jgi:predicted RNA binding protein YcfA (HicA-like mRNA interferase family)